MIWRSAVPCIPRARFVMALRLTTQALDAQTQSQRFSRALDDGLRALEEAADFQPRGSRLEAQLDLNQVVSTHRTVILKGTDLSSWTATAALQSYHVYAEQQLSRAGGHEVAAADALFGLARLQPFLTAGSGGQESSAGPIAMSLYQAALIIHPAHYLAANELAAMFVRYGQWQDAREVLRHATRVRPECPVLWENLAHIHDQLGERDLASLARHEWQAALESSKQQASTSTGPTVQWVDAGTFAASGRTDTDSIATPTTTAPPSAAAIADRSAADGWTKHRRVSRMPSAEEQPLSVGQRLRRRDVEDTPVREMSDRRR